MRWGFDDCFLFAADCSWAIKGSDPTPFLRGKWHDKTSAITFMRENGGPLEKVCTLLAKRAGILEINPLDAVSGDLGTVISPGHSEYQSMACRIDAGWVARTEHGFAVIREALQAWRV